MTTHTHWAILGTGAVANRFAAALHNISDRADLIAVGSRKQETADAFGEKHGVPHRFASYEQVAANSGVDVVYIATPHQRHQQDVALCLEAGKHVLCEKAFTLNGDEAQQLIDLARQKNLFLMEAMWTRFFPIHVQIRKLLAAGAIGEPRGLVVHHAYMGPDDPTIYDPCLGIGAMMDQAPYGVGLAFSLLGPPAEVKGLVTFSETGLSLQASNILRHRGGAISTLMSTRNTVDVKEAIVIGSTGKIEIHDPWYKPTVMTVHTTGHAPETIERPLDGFIGYEYEATAVMDCLERGETECAVMPLDETLAIMRTIDALRAQWEVALPARQVINVITENGLTSSREPVWIQRRTSLRGGGAVRLLDWRQELGPRMPGRSVQTQQALGQPDRAGCIGRKPVCTDLVGEFLCDRRAADDDLEVVADASF